MIDKNSRRPDGQRLCYFVSCWGQKQYVSDNAQLMAEWDWVRNEDIKSEQLAPNSHERVWWVCEKRSRMERSN